jgi:hypothetical protein
MPVTIAWIQIRELLADTIRRGYCAVTGKLDMVNGGKLSRRYQLSIRHSGNGHMRANLSTIRATGPTRSVSNTAHLSTRRSPRCSTNSAGFPGERFRDEHARQTRNQREAYQTPHIGIQAGAYLDIPQSNRFDHPRFARPLIGHNADGHLYRRVFRADPNFAASSLELRPPPVHFPRLVVNHRLIFSPVYAYQQHASDYLSPKRISGSLPVSLSGPIANPTTRQKSFLTLMNSKANRLGGRDPPVYCNLLSSCDRTSEQKSRCRVVGFAIGPDRLTGSSPVGEEMANIKGRIHNLEQFQKENIVVKEQPRMCPL